MAGALAAPHPQGAAAQGLSIPECLPRLLALCHEKQHSRRNRFSHQAGSENAVQNPLPKEYSDSGKPQVFTLDAACKN